jgi:hypothetical protein
MQDHNETSSDLELARRLTWKLSGPQRNRVRHLLSPTLEAESKDFTRVERTFLPIETKKEETGSAETDSEQICTEPISEEIYSFDPLLAWGKSVSGAESVFIVDSQGFVIASRGKAPADGFDAVGAEMCYKLSLLEGIESTAGKLVWADLEYNRTKIYGFRVTSEHEEDFIIGFISHSFVTDDLKRLIRHQFRRSLVLLT